MADACAEAETHRVGPALLVAQTRPEPTRGGGLLFNTAFGAGFGTALGMAPGVTSAGVRDDSPDTATTDSPDTATTDSPDTVTTGLPARQRPVRSTWCSKSERAKCW